MTEPVKGDSLGDRMKRNYEDRTRIMLPRRTFTVLRVDGKAFHTYTRGCEKPYDPRIVAAMDAVALALFTEAQGSRFAYIQSDEVSLVLADFATITTEAWFDGNLQKMASVAASIATAAFNAATWLGTGPVHLPGALFDCRVFTIPDPIEVENYFIWRQQDAVRNSIQSLAQSKFSHKRLQGLNMNQLQELLFQEHGLNWNDLPVDQKRGRAVIDGQLDVEPPTFTQDREYIRTRLSVRQD